MILKRHNLIAPIRKINRKPRILFDMDDVLCDCLGGICKLFNSKHDTNFKKSDCTTWGLSGIMGPEVMDVIYDPKLYENLKPLTKSLLTIENLYKTDLFDIFIVTAAPPTVVQAKVEWIKRNMPYFPVNTNLIICSSKDAVWGDVLIDDGPHNIEKYRDLGVTIIVDLPHNKGIKGTMRIRQSQICKLENFLIRHFYYQERIDSLRGKTPKLVKFTERKVYKIKKT